MSYKGLLLGKDAFLLADGSALRITDFSRRRDGLPSCPVLKREGVSSWSVHLDGEGLPTSQHGSHDSVDFHVLELPERGVVFFVADRFVFSLRAADGFVIGSAHTRFTGKESLDFFRVCPSPNGLRLAIVSTCQIAVFSAAGEVLADETVKGLICDCRWKSPKSLEYQVRRLDDPWLSRATRTMGV
jgi:hypothetical protein